MKRVIIILIIFFLSGCITYERYSFKFNYKTGEVEKIYHGLKTAKGMDEKDYTAERDWETLKRQTEEFRNQYDQDIIEPIHSELFKENNILSGKEKLIVKLPKAFPSVSEILKRLHSEDNYESNLDFRIINGELFLFLPKDKKIESTNGKILESNGNNIIAWSNEQYIYEFTIKITSNGKSLLPFYLKDIENSLLPPEGWRYPNESDYKDNWENFRKSIPIPFRIEADFNNDGIKDNAWILIRAQKVGWGLFVFLSSKDGKTEIIQLDDNPDDSHPQYMGISLVTPGKYKTACGKGYWECKQGEPEELELNYPAIDYFMYESANSIFYWDKGDNTFKNIWMSD
jgi:hypothetical protein